MINYLLLKYSIIRLKKYILIFLSTSILLFISFDKSFGEEDIFTINKAIVEGPIDVNFSREKYLNKAFSDSFKILMTKILLTRDLNKIGNIKLSQIKNQINYFHILEESYKEKFYKGKIKVVFSEEKIKNFLSEKNISFSNPENITAVFFPLLYIEDEFKNLSDNFFYNNWNEVDIDNELINFILPIDDLEDISQIIKMRNKIEKLNINKLVNKYDVKSYVYILMDFVNRKLKVYLNANFNGKKISKNMMYEIENIKNEKKLNEILKDLKIQTNDLWKEENLVNLLMPLSIKINFKHKNLKDLDKIKEVFNKIKTIKSFNLKEFNINNSYFKIYYYGNPKKLRSELMKFGYELKSNQGSWEIYLHE